MESFALLHRTPLGRRGRIQTRCGAINTPAFLPVGTAGAMRGITLEELSSLGAEILLCNTYHLHLRPGEEVIRSCGGLHEFLQWGKPIITDSGGYQVFSLRHTLQIEAQGVHFHSPIDGSRCFLGPREATEIQHALNGDIIMCFDECPPSTAPRKAIQRAVDRTLRWAKVCKEVHSDQRIATSGQHPLLFGIIQGGLERDLRKKCTEELLAIGFDGYAIGGLAVGETEEEMMGVLSDILPLLPEHLPRYLMGVCHIAQMRRAIEKGVDMFDSVAPMREARHGTLHLSDGSTIRITNEEFKEDHSPIDSESSSPLSRKHRRSYLCHLLRSGERAGETIACMQNLAVTLQALRNTQSAIEHAASHKVVGCRE